MSKRAIASVITSVLGNRRFKIALTVVAIVLLAAQAVSPWGQLLVRFDESWPHHRFFWLVRHPDRYQRGDLVAFRMNDRLISHLEPAEVRQRPYIRNGKLFLKQLVGMPGDQVTIIPLDPERDRIIINDRPVADTIGRDRLGNPIKTARLANRIPEHQYFVMLTHPRSFDSRYYGYVSLDMIEGRVIPLW